MSVSARILHRFAPIQFLFDACFESLSSLNWLLWSESLFRFWFWFCCWLWFRLFLSFVSLLKSSRFEERKRARIWSLFNEFWRPFTSSSEPHRRSSLSLLSLWVRNKPLILSPRSSESHRRSSFEFHLLLLFESHRRSSFAFHLLLLFEFHRWSSFRFHLLLLFEFHLWSSLSLSASRIKLLNRFPFSRSLRRFSSRSFWLSLVQCVFNSWNGTGAAR